MLVGITPLGVRNLDELEWKKKNSITAGYTHFDKRIGLNSAWNYIKNPLKVAQHGFYPFIYYEKNFNKVSKKYNVVKKNPKMRPICYSSHIDRCIYQYYGYLLNRKYNEYTLINDIDESVLAYRSNKPKGNNNNIYFAKKAFDFIKQENCNIMVGDFKNFFNNLDHKFLKRMLCKVLKVKSLSDDWYAVFKNITKYSTWDLLSLLEINGFKDNYKDIKKFNRQELAVSKKQFKELKGKNIKIHNKCGIPQGSAISAVLSNVYMIEFDEMMEEYISELNGLYLRYSDDFIIITPQNKVTEFKDVINNIHQFVGKTKGLKLQHNKTQVYSYYNSTIINKNNEYNIDLENGKNQIDYLGFVFDGKAVTLRDATISKYYTRMYKKLRPIIKANGISKHGNKISYENLYKTYTQKGRNIIHDPRKPYAKGNFLTYVYKAEKIFGKEEAITRSTKRHLLKIRRRRQKL